jgi:hypothetical protein
MAFVSCASLGGLYTTGAAVSPSSAKSRGEYPVIRTYGTFRAFRLSTRGVTGVPCRSTSRSARSGGSSPTRSSAPFSDAAGPTTTQSSLWTAVLPRTPTGTRHRPRAPEGQRALEIQAYGSPQKGRSRRHPLPTTAGRDRFPSCTIGATVVLNAAARRLMTGRRKSQAARAERPRAPPIGRSRGRPSRLSGATELMRSNQHLLT